MIWWYSLQFFTAIEYCHLNFQNILVKVILILIGSAVSFGLTFTNQKDWFNYHDVYPVIQFNSMKEYEHNFDSFLWFGLNGEMYYVVIWYMHLNCWHHITNKLNFDHIDYCFMSHYLRCYRTISRHKNPTLAFVFDYGILKSTVKTKTEL